MQIRLLILICLLTSLLTCQKAAAKQHYEYQVAICAVFQDEARFLKEWIEYHRLLGVDKFILFNNASEDDYDKVLQPYRDQNIVRLYNIENRPNTVQEWHRLQLKAYNWCLNNYRDKVHWLGFLDVDEYIVPMRDTSLPLLLADYDEYGGLSLTNLTFGMNDTPYIPPDMLRIEMLNRRAIEMYPMHTAIKSFVQPRYVDHFYNPHSPKFKKDRYAVNALKERTNGPFAYYPESDIVRIHHYRTGDMTQFYNIKKPRFSQWNPDVDHEELMKDYDVVEDNAIHRYVPRLRQRLGLSVLSGA